MSNTITVEAAIKTKTDQLNFTGSDVQSVASNMRGTDNALLSNDAKLNNLDETVSSRASQASVDGLNDFDPTSQTVTTDTASREASKADVTNLDVAVSTRASQASVDALPDDADITDLKENQGVINDNVKLASLIIPASDDLPNT